MPNAWRVATALLATLLLTGPVAGALRRRQILDLPNPRSAHREPIPRGGGIAVMIGILIGASVTPAPVGLWLLLPPTFAAAALGFADDLRGLSVGLRLKLQLMLACGVALLALESSDLDPLGKVCLLLAGSVCIAGYVNAFNFMDGVNGISGASGALVGGWFLLLGSSTHDSVLSAGGALLVGTCLGFLPWNVPRGRVFLGDVGSYGLGLFIGSLAAVAIAHGSTPTTAVAPLIPYVGDTAWTLLRRVLRGDPWRQPHRDHVYQQLHDAGLTHVQVSGVMAVLTVLVCAAFWWLPDEVGVLGAAGLLALYLASPFTLHALQRRGRAGQ